MDKDQLKEILNSVKLCTKCGDLKNKTEFSANKRTKSGLKSTCKLCDSLYAKKHYSLIGRDRYESKKQAI